MNAFLTISKDIFQYNADYEAWASTGRALATRREMIIDAARHLGAFVGPLGAELPRVPKLRSAAPMVGMEPDEPGLFDGFRLPAAVEQATQVVASDPQVAATSEPSPAPKLATDPFEEGEQAFRGGKQPEDNPYSSFDQDAAERWKAGWCTAKLTRRPIPLDGAEAYRAGICTEKCPFPDGENRKNWLEEWHAAQTEQMEKAGGLEKARAEIERNKRRSKREEDVE